jgi:proteasome lid subunit RPN8/RPN11
VILADGRLVRWRRGGPAHVDFDWSWVMGREEEKGDVAGFFHTHPAGVTGMSGRDRATMEAWAVSFGKPLVCAIRCGRSLRAWMCDAAGAAREVEATLTQKKLRWTS